jgi:hypothetical protein
MPVKQLRGFRRITLVPGQTQTVTLTLGPDELSYWSVPDGSFRIEGGTYLVRVGGSSDNLPLTGVFRLTSSMLYDSVTGETSSALRPVLANTALHRSVKCSSIEGAHYTCGSAADGDLTTRWSSQFGDSQWISVDLGAQMNIERVILHWETAYGEAYRIQVSNDAIHWTDVYGTTSGDGEVDNLDVSDTGRYVRMYATRRGTEWGYSLWELQVFAKPDSICPPPVRHQCR